MIRSRLYRGRVFHHRFAPREHRFAYDVAYLGLDLDELPWLLERHPWCGHRRPAAVRYHRGDYLGDPALDLATALRTRLRDRVELDPGGRIELVTTLRTLGYAFNPVSFYVCRDRDERVRCILAEITNTPWRERHVEVLPTAGHGAADGPWSFAFDKSFHISPFMPMDQRYAWRFDLRPGRVAIRMSNRERGATVFTAGMVLQPRPWSRSALSRHLLAMPLAPLQIVGRIYHQALRLWLKGIPVHDHPASTGPTMGRAPAPSPSLVSGA